MLCTINVVLKSPFDECLQLYVWQDLRIFYKVVEPKHGCNDVVFPPLCFVCRAYSRGGGALSEVQVLSLNRNQLTGT